jgi:hypothetical protein
MSKYHIYTGLKAQSRQFGFDESRSCTLVELKCKKFSCAFDFYYTTKAAKEESHDNVDIVKYLYHRLLLKTFSCTNAFVIKYAEMLFVNYFC